VADGSSRLISMELGVEKEAILLVLEEVERRALCPPENCRIEVVVV